MSDYTRLINEQFHGDEGHRIMSSDVPEEEWHRFDDHVIFDVQRMDDVLAANEAKRFDDWADSVIADPYDDGDEDS